MKTIASTTNLNIRIDSNLKKESDSLFKSLGLNMTTARRYKNRRCSI